MKLVSLVAGLALSLPAGVAFAQSYTITNTTTVDGSDGKAYTYPTNFIGGTTYQTVSLTVSQTGSTATLSYITGFSGNANAGGYTVGYADVFFGGIWSGTAIAMGDQKLSTGVYTVQSAETSQQLWNGRGVTYGAGYGPNDSAVDTVLTSGKLQSSMPIALTQVPITSGQYAGYYDLSFTIQDLPFNMVKDFENGSLWALWGTGDCANGAFVQVPEPAGVALFGLGVLGLSIIRSRRKSASQV